MFLVLLLVACVLAGLATYAILLTTGVLPGAPARDRSRRESAGVPRLGEMSQGCLMGVVVAGAVWFLLWGVVLVLALRLLRTPFTS